MQPDQDAAAAAPYAERLRAARDAGDDVTLLALLAQADFAFPLPPGATARTATAQWATVGFAGSTYVVAYTSADALRDVSGGAVTDYRVLTLAEALAGWPDTRWHLAIDAGTPGQLLLSVGSMARLVAPTLALQARMDPAGAPPVLQQLIRPETIPAILGGGPTRVSGYLHLHGEVAHIATPTVLLDTVGIRDAAYLDDRGSLTMLRWRAIGPELYPVPYGGTDAERRDGVEGWLVDDAPFVGTGFGPNPDVVVHEYRAAAVALPSGAEMWELDMEGRQHRRAVYDGDDLRWLLATPAPQEEPATDATQDGPPGPRLATPTAQDRP